MHVRRLSVYLFVLPCVVRFCSHVWVAIVVSLCFIHTRHYFLTSIVEKWIWILAIFLIKEFV